MRLKLTTLILSLAVCANLNAQQTDFKEGDPQAAEQKLLLGNFDEALDAFLNLHEVEPKNEKYIYNIAVCYLNLHQNKTKAIPYLELLSHKPKHDPNVDYLLGRAYHYANKFDEAITSYNKFKTNGKGTADNLKNVDQQIQYCLNAKELMKYPIDVKFESLGDNVNSEYAENYAFIPTNEAFVIFNTNRPEKGSEAQANGDFKNSIYVSEVVDGNFQKAYSIGSPINKGNTGEEIVGLSANGDIMILYIKDGIKSGNLYISKKDENGNFKKPELLDKNINSAFEEIAASISSDGNILYFASNRPGGLGGTDIYQSKRDPKGKWGLPTNLGADVNTAQNEDFPNISPDGKTLYFSSTGHSSMGGYDLFKVKFDEETQQWKNAQNLGYPLSTTDDDLNFRISQNERYGYISGARNNTTSDNDLYRVIFNAVEAELSVIKGQVLAEDGTQINYPDVLITVTNDANKEIVGNYLPNSNTGKYIIILAPGKYTLDVELFDFKIKTQKLEIKDKISFESEIDMDLKLEHIK